MKVLFFSPFCSIWVHAFPEALVAEALAQSGHEIVYITCGGLYKKYCIGMNAHCLNSRASIESKGRVCDICNKQRDVILKNFKFRSYSLKDKYTMGDRDAVDRILQGANPDWVVDLNVESIDVGRIALYEFLLTFKKMNFYDFSKEQWNEYLIAVENSLLTLYIMKRILQEERPDRLVLHNALYSVNQICCQLARQSGVIDYETYASNNFHNRYERHTIGRGGRINVNRFALAHWEKYRVIPLALEDLRVAVNHQLVLMQGADAFVYSPVKSAQGISIRERYGIKSAQKICVAIMSSYDEIFAAQSIGLELPEKGPLFPSQVAWIRALGEYFLEHPELFLIIRVHPREYSNKREGMKSEHAILLEEELKVLPENVKVNWPDARISLYEFVEEADVFLCAWSSVAKEVTSLGIPVVIYFIEFSCYPFDLVYVGHTKEEYFNKLQEALRNGWSIENVRKTYRWMALEYCRSSFAISESYKGRAHIPGTIWGRLWHKILNKLSSGMGYQVADCNRRAPELKSRKVLNDLIVSGKNSLLDIADISKMPHVSEFEETGYLRKELRRVVEALYGGKVSRDPRTLSYKLDVFLKGEMA